MAKEPTRRWLPGAQARTCLAGAVGEDGFAAAALALLAQASVNLAGVKRTGEPTGTALILVGDNGENMIAVVPSANGTVTTSD